VCAVVWQVRCRQKKDENWSALRMTSPLISQCSILNAAVNVHGSKLSSICAIYSSYLCKYVWQLVYATFFGRIWNEINVMFVILYKVVVKNCPMWI
jgi:hypothetical protein